VTVLSDDEIVAIAVKDGASWPGPLPTINLGEREMLQAIVRGVRSLLARELVTMIGIDYEVSADVRTLIGQATLATHAASAYVSEVSSPGQLKGSSAYLYFGESGAVIDLVTLGGVHEVGEVSADGGLSVLTALADNAHRFGIEAEEGAEPALYVRSTAHPEEARRITKGKLAIGRIVGEGAKVKFDSTAESHWDDAELKAFLGVPD
jgi:hypothetical protein